MLKTLITAIFCLTMLSGCVNYHEADRYFMDNAQPFTKENVLAYNELQAQIDDIDPDTFWSINQTEFRRHIREGGLKHVTTTYQQPHFFYKDVVLTREMYNSNIKAFVISFNTLYLNDTGAIESDFELSLLSPRNLKAEIISETYIPYREHPRNNTYSATFIDMFALASLSDKPEVIDSEYGKSTFFKARKQLSDDKRSNVGNLYKASYQDRHHFYTLNDIHKMNPSSKNDHSDRIYVNALVAEQMIKDKTTVRLYFAPDMIIHYKTTDQVVAVVQAYGSASTLVNGRLRHHISYVMPEETLMTPYEPYPMSYGLFKERIDRGVKYKNNWNMDYYSSSRIVY
ncbi:hypothetical protein AB4571_15295 [Vibrio breoganii]|uniref:hypothetical protein n=1 Tax=Vibrio breoganii TaxID=553239 RepID=UPI000C824EC2|nr:hypothetical protein [Vibrio breoganii]PML13824.1 hypothetical protein BCT84_12600 [Vibrio breoganii]